MRRSLGAGLLLAGGALALPGGGPPQDVIDSGAVTESRDSRSVQALTDAPVSLDGLPETVTRLLQALPEPEARRLRRHAIRWQGWSPEQRAAFAGRVGEWEALTAGERVRHREAWQALQALPEAQREDLLGMAREFARRPEAEQAELRQRFAELDSVTRRGWLLGPSLGADYPALHPLLAQLPADQHGPLLEVLRSMTAAQRVQLGVLAQRTPPQERDALRQELIATPPERRQQWLWERLEM